MAEGVLFSPKAFSFPDRGLLALAVGQAQIPGERSPLVFMEGKKLESCTQQLIEAPMMDSRIQGRTQRSDLITALTGHLPCPLPQVFSMSALWTFGTYFVWGLPWALQDV